MPLEQEKRFFKSFIDIKGDTDIARYIDKFFDGLFKSNRHRWLGMVRAVPIDTTAPERLRLFYLEKETPITSHQEHKAFYRMREGIEDLSLAIESIIRIDEYYIEGSKSVLEAQDIVRKDCERLKEEQGLDAQLIREVAIPQFKH